MTDWIGTPVADGDVDSMIREHPHAAAYESGGVLRIQGGLVERFREYRAAKLAFRAKRVGQIVDWLRNCEYVTDEVQHGRRDAWMHPADFERVRAGDCEDHAIWAWVQLSRLGLDARFVAGDHDGGHAWVTYRERDAWFLFETTDKRPGTHPQPAEREPGYIPVWSVDGGVRFYVHAPEQPGIEFL